MAVIAEVANVFVALLKVRFAFPAKTLLSLNCICVLEPAAATEEALIPVILVLVTEVILPLLSTANTGTWEPDP